MSHWNKYIYQIQGGVLQLTDACKLLALIIKHAILHSNKFLTIQPGPKGVSSIENSQVEIPTIGPHL